MKIKHALNKHELKNILDRFQIKIHGTYHIREDGTIDVNGNVIMSSRGLKRIPLQFGKVTGCFLCCHNQLTTLKGCPTSVGGTFNCHDNKLSSLKYGPGSVGGNYLCHENLLTSLKGSPNEINGNFVIATNLLSSLEGCPKTVVANVYMQSNQLSTLINSPRKIGGSLHVEDNPLLTLIGCPEFVGNTLFFNNSVRLDTGGDKCIVKSVVIKRKKEILAPEYKLPEIVIVNQRHLPIICKYMEHLNLYPDGKFDYDLLTDMVLEIKEGFL